MNDPLELFTYANSKVCNIITANGFAEKLKGTGITSNSLHPGTVQTDIFSKVNNVINHNNSNVKRFNYLLNRFYLSFYGKVRINKGNLFIV